VTIDDDTAGQITFTVTPLSPLTSIATTNFGVQSFDFNVTGENPLVDSPSPMWALPINWAANVAPPPNQADGFGRFDVEVADGGSSRQSPLVFRISDSTGLTLERFNKLSTGTAAQGNVYFAAHISGHLTADPQVTSAYFGASSMMPVPIPAGGLLLLSALSILGEARRWRRTM
jgi:hypothetical protein